ncbi:DUF3196 family protein [Sporosarcina sp. FSL K6-1522]|uniref:DUF3196 family protein n=1 Tax=Sporosarcina sp. FSL K6-1522 TaxID=2921554 RepID=UPI003159CD45
MRRKYGRLRKTDKVIVFPGTYERLVEKGLTAVEQSNFEQAVKAFDQAIHYEPDYPEFLGPYAVALYETKDFHRAKEVAAKLLHSGTMDYMDAMELYLTISIQLEEYEEVETTIGALIDEGVVPHGLVNKFHYLRELNARLSQRYAPNTEIAPKPPFTLEEFIDMDAETQQYALASLEGSDLSALTPTLVAIAERADLVPIVITFALTLLYQADYTADITVCKFGLEKVVVPAEMVLPGQDEQTLRVLAAIEGLFFKEPSRLELAQGIIEKFAIAAFPFGWGKHSIEEIATAYVQYIESLFSGEQLPETELHLRIQQIDNDLS